MANTTDLIVRLRAEQSQLRRDLKKARGEMKSFKSSTSKFASQIRTQLAGAFAIGSVLSFGKAVVDTTAEFEKLRAVLANTLGSQSQAEKAFENINKFASSTPFSVLELTNSFVKLANFGLKPTTSALRAYGDLAASTGKSFDQLSEAIIDATTGEFERLKEFGVRASKQGDIVEFTFKGVKTQVDFTSDSIREYIESLGDAEGVSGSMEAISGTLAGKLSNLDDSFTNLKATIGGLVAGPLKNFVDSLNGILNINADKSVEEISSEIESLNSQIAELEKQGGLESQVDVLKQMVRQLSLVKSQMNNTFGPQGIPQIDLSKPGGETTTTSGNKKTSNTPLLEGLSSISDPALISDFSEGLDRIPTKLQEFRARTLDELSIINESFKVGFFELQNVILESGQQIEAVFLDVGDLIIGGINALKAGFDIGGLEGAFQAFKMFLGDAMVQLGQGLVAINTGKLALTKVPPPLGIAIGGALIAAGYALSNSGQKKLDNLANSGGLGGGGFNGGSASTQLAGQSVNINGELRIKGEDLVYQFNQYNRNSGRIGG